MSICHWLLMTSFIYDWLLTNNCKFSGLWGHVIYTLFKITFGRKYKIFLIKSRKCASKNVEQEVVLKITIAKVVPNHSYSDFTLLWQ